MTHRGAGWAKECPSCGRLFGVASSSDPVPPHGHPDDMTMRCRGSGQPGITHAPAG